ncbi:hypothetical protein GCM10009115_11330 [Sphingopyxis soli]|uniref:Secreted protein n=1 Tax=Sphingopyxis soli TaxID=592051 RepID=A0ABN1M134_9SPHN|nr:hypothetical protein [Sphingopyxis soli]
MHKLRLVFVCVGLATSFTAIASEAMASDARANESVALFKSFCVATAGDKARALSVLGEGNALARRLPEAVTTAMFGKSGGVAWALSSPSQAQLLLAYNPMGICEVRIAEADEAAMIEQFHALTTSLSTRSSSNSGQPEKRRQGNANLTYETFNYEVGGQKALLAITTSDQRVGEQQHVITFSFVS